MRIINKNECEYKKGYIVYDGEVVAIPLPVALQLRTLENTYQRALYINAQPAGHPAPSLDGFEFKSEHEIEVPLIENIETPALDAKIAESLAIAEDIEKCQHVGEVNEYRMRFKDLFEFVNNDEFVEGGASMKLDLAYIGNPLKLTADNVVEMMTLITATNIVFDEFSVGDVDGDR